MTPESKNPLKILGQDPAFINIGVDLFAETLKQQGANVFIVIWNPPSKTPQDILDILKKII